MKFRNENNEWQNIRVQNYGIEQTPIGSMIYYPSLDIPDGYLLCDGREVLIADYPLLFNAIGYIGGDDVLTGYFRLPDMQGVVPGGFNPNLLGVDHPLAGDFGDQVGSPRHALTVEELASHHHGVSDDLGTDMRYTMNLDWGTSSIARRMVATSEDSNITAMTANLDAADSTGTGDIGQAAGTGYTGEGQEFSIVQPTKLYNWIIKAKNIVTLGGYTEDFEIKGKLTLPLNKYVENGGAIDLRNSDIVRANGIYFQDAADGEGEGINFARTTTASGSVNSADYDQFRIYNGVMRINDDIIKCSRLINGGFISENGTTVEYGSYIISDNLMIATLKVTATSAVPQYKAIAKLENLGLVKNGYIYGTDNETCYVNSNTQTIDIYKAGGLAAGDSVVIQNIATLSS